MRRLSIASSLLGIALPVSAQSDAILGSDNAAFARGLADAGLDDLAEGMSRVIQTRPTSDDEGLEIEALGLSLRQMRAEREPDPLARRDLLIQIITDKNEFVSGHSRSKSAEYVRGNLPESYLMLGEALTAAIEAETDAAKIAALREDGLKRFADAEKSLRDRIAWLDERFSEGTLGASYAQRQLAIASYGLARTLYFHALLYPDQDPEQKKVLEEAIDAFSNFALDFGDYLQSYEGLVYQGLCDKRLGDAEIALEDFEGAIGLREGYALDENGVYDAPPEAVDIISWAFQEKMRLLAELGEHEQALLAAKDYAATLPDPYAASRGPAVLHARARAEKELGDIAAARESAQQLIALDPQGQYGAAGRALISELIGGQSADDPTALLEIAETISANGEHDRALDFCRQARTLAAANPEHAAAVSRSFLLAGDIYYRQDRLHEASIAFDSAAELTREPLGGDALWKAVYVYQRLHSQERRPFYEKRVQDRMRQLANRYPSHPKAAYAQLIEGQLLEGQGDWQRALDFYLQMKPDAQGYEEGQYRAGNCLYSLYREQADEGKEAEARATAERAEKQLRTAMELLDKAEKDTLDRELQEEFKTFEFAARGRLSDLLLDTGRAVEVDELLADAETRYGAGSERIAKVWTLRIRAKQEQGALDEAIELYQSLLQKDPDAPGISASAGVLARALDSAGVELFTADPASARGAELWRKAAHYYGLSIAPQLSGAASLRPDDVGEIAQRLYVMGLFFNGVPETADTFVDWQEKPKDPALWEEAAGIYRRLLEVAPSTRTTIQLARTYGLLQRYEEAAQLYGRVFDTVQLVESGPSGTFNSRVVRANPELIPAYLEWGVAEHLAGMAEKDKDRQARAYTIFERMLANTEANSRLWWQSKYFQIRSLFDRGDYPKAKIAMRDVKRTNSDNFDEGKYGLQPRFQALETELKKK
jgi:tetratricopeptide (TPR) repeat protein